MPPIPIDRLNADAREHGSPALPGNPLATKFIVTAT